VSGHGSSSKGKFATFMDGVGAFSILALARGTALFVAAYTLANAIANYRTPQATTSLWWIDMSFLPNTAALLVGVASAVALIGYGAWPKMAAWRRVLTATAAVCLTAAALLNVSDFYRSWAVGVVRYAFPIPLALVLAVVFTLLSWAALALSSHDAHAKDHFAAGVAFVLVASLFPLLQIVFFGTTNYRAKADAAVVFGPRVYDKGRLKTVSSRDRVATAIDLYMNGYARTLIIAGGRTSKGVDETMSMRDAAVSAGVPSSAIITDLRGTNTATIVRDTTAMFDKRGIRDVLVVCQSYELPRIKLAYLSAGWVVRTVPTKQLVAFWKKPLVIAQEIPGFWDYWSRAFARDVQGS
jgi:uncharacterized SAM-binding protein YcdF (DUF218 family)